MGKQYEQSVISQKAYEGTYCWVRKSPRCESERETCQDFSLPPHPPILSHKRKVIDALGWEEEEEEEG